MLDMGDSDEPDIKADLLIAQSCEQMSCRRVADHAINLKNAAFILKSYAIQQHHQQQQNNSQSTPNDGGDAVWSLKRRLEAAEAALSRARAGCLAMQRQIEAGLCYRREAQQLKTELRHSQEATAQYRGLLEEGNRFRNDLRVELEQARKAASIARAELAKEQRLRYPSHTNAFCSSPTFSDHHESRTATSRWLETAQEEENAKLRASVRLLTAKEIDLATKLEEVRSSVEKECLRLTMETPRPRKRPPRLPAISNFWFLSLAGILGVPAPPLSPNITNDALAPTSPPARKRGRPKKFAEEESEKEEPLSLESVLNELEEVGDGKPLYDLLSPASHQRCPKSGALKATLNKEVTGNTIREGSSPQLNKRPPGKSKAKATKPVNSTATCLSDSTPPAKPSTARKSPAIQRLESDHELGSPVKRSKPGKVVAEIDDASLDNITRLLNAAPATPMQKQLSLEASPGNSESTLTEKPLTRRGRPPRTRPTTADSRSLRQQPRTRLRSRILSEVSSIDEEKNQQTRNFAHEGRRHCSLLSDTSSIDEDGEERVNSVSNKGQSIVAAAMSPSRKLLQRTRLRSRLFSEASSIEEEQMKKEFSTTAVQGASASPPSEQQPGATHHGLQTPSASPPAPIAVVQHPTVSVDLDAGDSCSPPTLLLPSLENNYPSPHPPSPLLPMAQGGAVSSPVLRPSSPYIPASPNSPPPTLKLLPPPSPPPPSPPPPPPPPTRKRRRLPVAPMRELSPSEGRIQTRPSALGGAKRPRRTSIATSLTQLIADRPQYSQSIADWFLELTNFPVEVQEEIEEAKALSPPPTQRFQIIDSRSLLIKASRAEQVMPPQLDAKLSPPRNGGLTNGAVTAEVSRKSSIPLGSCVGMESGLYVENAFKSSPPTALQPELIAYLSGDLSTPPAGVVAPSSIPPALLRALGGGCWEGEDGDGRFPHSITLPHPPPVVRAVSLLRSAQIPIKPADFAAWFRHPAGKKTRRRLSPIGVYHLAQTAFLGCTSASTTSLLYPLALIFLMKGYPLGCLLLASQRCFNEGGGGHLEAMYQRLVSTEELPQQLKTMLQPELAHRGWWHPGLSSTMKDDISGLADAVLKAPAEGDDALEAAWALRLVLTALRMRSASEKQSSSTFVWLLKARLMPWINSLSLRVNGDSNTLCKLLCVSSLAIDVLLLMAQLEAKQSQQNGHKELMSPSQRFLLKTVEKLFDLLTARLKEDTQADAPCPNSLRAIYNLLRMLPCLGADQVDLLTELVQGLSPVSSGCPKPMDLLPPFLFPQQPCSRSLNIPSSSLLAEWLQQTSGQP